MDTQTHWFWKWLRGPWWFLSHCLCAAQFQHVFEVFDQEEEERNRCPHNEGGHAVQVEGEASCLAGKRHSKGGRVKVKVKTSDELMAAVIFGQLLHPHFDYLKIVADPPPHSRLPDRALLRHKQMGIWFERRRVVIVGREEDLISWFPGPSPSSTGRSNNNLSPEEWLNYLCTLSFLPPSLDRLSTKDEKSTTNTLRVSMVSHFSDGTIHQNGLYLWSDVLDFGVICESLHDLLLHYRSHCTSPSADTSLRLDIHRSQREGCQAQITSSDEISIPSFVC